MAAYIDVNNPFAALKSKNFRYFGIGQCISLIGTWLQNTALSWLVLTLTKSAFLVGLFNALQFTPQLFLSLFAGAIIDHFPKKKLLIITQSLLMIVAFLLSFLIWTKVINYPILLVFALALGIINTFDMPARQSFVIELAGQELLINAVALNSLNFNLARVIGPAIAGILLKNVGMSVCFFLNGLSFIAVLIGLFLIDVGLKPLNETKSKGMLKDILEGLKYTKNNRVILQTMILILIMNVFIMNFNVLIPLYTKYVLHKDEAGYGFLLSSMGIGALSGALFVASTSRKLDLKRLYFSLVMCSLILIFIGINKDYKLSSFLFAAVGFFMILFTTTANSTLQLSSADEYRGRVMSLYTLVFAGTTPIGSLIAGTFAQIFKVGGAFVICGIFCFVLFILEYLIFEIIFAKA
ncbi:major facilitator superfamily MFS_1 [Caldicellulosiruptor saccharolyticus DSM 8903]|uniref:Major facilitator superfamily MFS_1 n=1 Tax=Caldicellulosiruptor saccharolyticus (strain ATCC 43494 / DSM 8903 / Tp8T 6331) TaxID=351627 RepID=A4XHM0_CALS8|nr:MFS transporter [Caldicellulosiruptor saccharolyticus]ABP66405.1 major facilitator superfamily MFS_1 [Caldicellulosiruptor saccharolyticus DSM 8903]